MAISKEKKVTIVNDLAKKLDQAKTVVFVNFHGLTVGGATELRRGLRASEVGLTVAKKTLIRRALADQKVTGEQPELAGEIAVAYGADVLAPAREVYEFEKKHKEVVKIVGGIYEGAYVDAAMILSLATIPSREVLLGKLVNILNSPIQRIVMVLDQISKTKQA